MSLTRRDLLLAACGCPLSPSFWLGPASADQGAPLPAMDWTPVEVAVNGQVAAGKLPGAVVILGDARGIWLRRAWGMKSLVPRSEPMRIDTLFDLASLTKSVATATAVLQLSDRGLIDLDAAMAAYWPDFAAHGKDGVTVRQLLSHHSGLRAGFRPDTPWQGMAGALRALAAEQPVAPPGTLQRYSDLNFIALGELVRRRSRLGLDDYCRRHVFRPVGMRQTFFIPPERWRLRAAPTAPADHGLARLGIVQDPTARRMGGIAGHAGLFATADDLARFAQAVLAASQGRLPRWLSVASVRAMATPQMCGSDSPWRGLGWALEAPLCPERERLAPMGTIHHTGYTGTAVWIDLIQQRFAILLSNRLHVPGGDARPLRRQVAALVSGVAEPLDRHPVAVARAPCAIWPVEEDHREPIVHTGCDQLRAQAYGLLLGKRVGLITHAPAIDTQGWRTVDRLRWARGVDLVRLFSPEHGLMADVDRPVRSGVEPLSGLPVSSLYGDTRRMRPDMLEGLDVLVSDLQDVGARFFTHASTMGRAMEAAAAARLPFVVLDRPNAIGAHRVGGPMLDAGRESFTAFMVLPVQHGMTMGELARLFANEIERRQGTPVDLHVVPMAGYRRSMSFEQTGLDWVPPSPNLRTPEAALLYPGVAWVEGANVSVGRGTPRPFGLIGAPWIDEDRWMALLAAYPLHALAMTPTSFTPSSGPHAGKPCKGIGLRLLAGHELDAPLLGLALVSTLFALWPDHFEIERTRDLVGSAQTIEAIHSKMPWRDIVEAWRPGLQSFMSQRETCLLYP